MSVEKLVELAGETEVLGENLPQCRFVNTNSTKFRVTWVVVLLATRAQVEMLQIHFVAFRAW
jgi:hypothetical protein